MIFYSSLLEEKQAWVSLLRDCVSACRLRSASGGTVRLGKSRDSPTLGDSELKRTTQQRASLARAWGGKKARRTSSLSPLMMTDGHRLMQGCAIRSLLSPEKRALSTSSGQLPNLQLQAAINPVNSPSPPSSPHGFSTSPLPSPKSTAIPPPLNLPLQLPVTGSPRSAIPSSLLSHSQSPRNLRFRESEDDERRDPQRSDRNGAHDGERGRERERDRDRQRERGRSRDRDKAGSNSRFRSRTSNADKRSKSPEPDSEGRSKQTKSRRGSSMRDLRVRRFVALG